MATNLRGCHIIERDENNETLWAWSFPKVSDSQKEFVLRKYAEIDTQTQVFAFCKFENEWCYFYTVQVFETDALPKVKHCALVLWSIDYHPEKYSILSRILSKRYCKTGDPTIILQLYLSVMTKGVCTTEENGTFQTDRFRDNSGSANSQVAELITTFGLETIIIYTALLLNKKLFVYDHNLSTLLRTIETLPNLMTHRDFKSCIYPWVHLVTDEINDLKKHSGYIAGSLDSNLTSRLELFDILVNVAAREVAVSPHARDAFVMTKTHKDIALFMVQLAETPGAEIVSEIARKTQDLLTQLRSLATTSTPENKKMVSLETLRERNFPSALENFLFNLAVAENIMLL